VQAARARQRQARPPRVGRPKEPLVTGYLIGDDSSLAKPKGCVRNQNQWWSRARRSGILLLL